MIFPKVQFIRKIDAMTATGRQVILRCEEKDYTETEMAKILLEVFEDFEDGYSTKDEIVLYFPASRSTFSLFVLAFVQHVLLKAKLHQLRILMQMMML